MESFLHIGYPKCFSTTLQREYYSKHPDIFFGGIGVGERNIDFYNDELNLFFESGLIYFRSVMYRQNEMRFQQAMEDFMQAAAASSKKVAGFSSEHILFNFTPQTVDVPEKLCRIKRLFGGDVKLIWVIREHFSLLLSMYNEYVKMGYAGTLQDYFSWFYKYQDRNFYLDLQYNIVLQEIEKVFDRSNIKLLFFEDYKGPDGQLTDEIAHSINRFLNISDFRPSFSNRNPSMPEQELEALRKINKTVKYDFGSDILHGIEDHRRRVFFNNYLHLGLSESELFDNVIIKRKAREMIPSFSTKSGLDYTVNADIINRLSQDFDADIAALSANIGINVSERFSSARESVMQKIQING